MLNRCRLSVSTNLRPEDSPGTRLDSPRLLLLEARVDVDGDPALGTEPDGLVLSLLLALLPLPLTLLLLLLLFDGELSTTALRTRRFDRAVAIASEFTGFAGAASPSAAGVGDSKPASLRASRLFDAKPWRLLRLIGEGMLLFFFFFCFCFRRIFVLC